jgi:AcrR family transcriptional regulator
MTPSKPTAARTLPRQAKAKARPERPSAGSRPDRREQLVSAALKLFSCRPYDEVSIDDIAEEADVAHGLMSYYFGGKRGVYLAALQRVQHDLQQLTRPLASDGDLTGKIKGMARRHFEYFRAHPQVMLGLLVSAPRDVEARAVAESAHLAGAQELVGLMGVSGELRPELRTALRGCMGFIDELTVDWLTHGQDLDIEYLVEVSFAATSAAVALALDRPVDDLGRVAIRAPRKERSATARAPRRSNPGRAG